MKRANPWSITFAQSQPVAVAFDDDQIAVTISGRRFTRGDQMLNDAMGITVTYKIEKTPTGSVLTRQGDVQVEYLRLESLGVPQVTFKTFLRPQIHRTIQRRDRRRRDRTGRPLGESSANCSSSSSFATTAGPLSAGKPRPRQVRTAKAKGGKKKLRIPPRRPSLVV